MVSKEGASSSKEGAQLGLTELLGEAGHRHKCAVTCPGQQAQIQLQNSAIQ